MMLMVIFKTHLPINPHGKAVGRDPFDQPSLALQKKDVLEKEIVMQVII